MNFTAEQWQAVGLSLRVAIVAVLMSFPFGLALAWLLARRRFRGKAILETVINLPLVLPPVVTGYLLLVAFGRNGFMGQFLDRWFGVQIVFTWKAAALASAIMAFPLMVRSIRLALSSVDVHLEQAARTLGAGPWDTLWTITLPLARHGIIAGCVLAFARSIGEFGATIMVSENTQGSRTIPLEIYNLLESPGGVEKAQSLVFASIAIAAVAMLIGEILERRGLGAPRRRDRMARLRFHCRHQFASGFSLDAEFDASDGVTGLCGPSGSGKTTTLAIIAGTLRPKQGTVRLGERVLLDTDRRIALPPERRQVACVFQDLRLFPHLSVEQNMRYGLNRRPARKIDFSRVVEILELGTFLNRSPRTLSGGQQQRVALARAVLQGPELLLLDEPLTALDAELKERIVVYLERMLAELKLPTILVSHDLADVRRLAEQVIMLDAGRVVRIGSAKFGASGAV